MFARLTVMPVFAHKQPVLFLHSGGARMVLDGGAKYLWVRSMELLRVQ